MLFGDIRKSKFKSSYKKIKKYLKPYIDDEKCNVEIVAVLIVVYDFAIFNTRDILNKYKERKSMANIMIPFATKLADTDTDYLQKRMDFYGEFIRGKQPRCDFCFGDGKNTDNPLLRVIMALGDVMYNTDLINNYDSGAVLIGDIFEGGKFAVIIKKVSEEIIFALDNATHHLW